MVRKLFNNSSSSNSNSNSNKKELILDLDITNLKIGTSKNVVLLLKWLDSNNAIKEEGIFRVSGNTTTMELIKKNFSQGKDDLSNFTSCDINSIASCLKFILRELPEPLFTYNFYPIFIKIQIQLDDFKRLFFLKMLVHALPSSNRALVLQLLAFLNKFSMNQNENKMSPYNLATVFAPNILRPKEESQFQLMSNSDSIGIIETLIEEYNFISNLSKNITSSPEIIPKPILSNLETEELKQQNGIVKIQEYLIAIAHTPQQPSCFKKNLSFKKGDTINLIDIKCDGSFVGELNGVTGYLPSSYIEIKDISQPGQTITIQPIIDQNSQKLTSTSSHKINTSPNFSPTLSSSNSNGSNSPSSSSLIMNNISLSPFSTNSNTITTTSGIQRTSTCYFSTNKPSLSISQPINIISKTKPSSPPPSHHAFSMGNLPPSSIRESHHLPPLPQKPPPLMIPNNQTPYNTPTKPINNYSSSSANTSNCANNNNLSISINNSINNNNNNINNNNNNQNHPLLSNRSQSSIFLTGSGSNINNHSSFTKKFEFTSLKSSKSKSPKNSPTKKEKEKEKDVQKSPSTPPPIIHINESYQSPFKHYNTLKKSTVEIPPPIINSITKTTNTITTPNTPSPSLSSSMSLATPPPSRILNYSFSSFSLSCNNNNQIGGQLSKEEPTFNLKSCFENTPPLPSRTSNNNIPILPPRPPPLNIPTSTTNNTFPQLLIQPPQNKNIMLNTKNLQRSSTSMLLNKLPPPPFNFNK